MILSIVVAMTLDTTRLQIGTKWGGELSTHFQDANAEVDEIHRFALRWRVTGKDGENWIVEQQRKMLGTKIGEHNIPPPDVAEPALAKERLDLQGGLVGLEPYDQGTFRLERMLHFWLPAGAPAQWSAELPNSSEQFIPKAKATFEFVGFKGASIRAYTFNYQELEVSIAVRGSGRVQFDVPTGRLVFAKVEARNALPPGGLGRMNVILTYQDRPVTKPLE